MRINYYISETFTNLRRNLLMTIAAVSTVAISLLLLGGALLLGNIVSNMTKSWEAKVEVSVFLRLDAAPGEVQSLQEELEAMDEVEDVEYVSQEEAYQEYLEIFGNDQSLIVPGLEESLPASLRVKLVDPDDTQLVADRIQGSPGIDEVNAGGAIIRRLLQVNSLLRTAVLAMAVILMIAAAALIANTIRVAIYARREEIAIMKLVGATNWFIRIPFMFEGVIAALLGALIAGGAVVAADRLLFARAGDYITFLAPVFSFSGTEIAQILGILLGVGAVVGLLGSGMALRRFLEV